MRLSLPIVIVIVLGYAFLIGMMLFVLDKYLDLRVISYTWDANRQANNLMHLILSPKQSLIAKEKLVIDLNMLQQYETNWLTNQQMDTSERYNWEDCCDLLEYEMNFSVTKLGGNKHSFGNLLFDMNSECYFVYQRIKGYIEMPVLIYSENADGTENFDPGIANLILMRTPLSEVAFWISQSSLRISEGFDNYMLKNISVYCGDPLIPGDEVERIIIWSLTPEKGIICMVVNNILLCKRFSFETTPQLNICSPLTDCAPIGFPPGYSSPSLGECQKIMIEANMTSNTVDVYLP